MCLLPSSRRTSLRATSWGSRRPAMRLMRMDKEIGKDEGQTGGDNDARTLWVEYDEQGERHREWRKVVADCAVHSWKDWQHEGPPSLQYAVKQFGKIGGDPRLWFQLWLRRHHLAETDRTAHEVRTLSEAIYLGGCYDQLNLPP